MRWGRWRVRTGSCGAQKRRRDYLAVSALLERLGVDSHAGDLWKFFLHAVFEGGGDVVHLRDQQRAFHNAVAGSENMVLDLAGAYVVAVDKLVVFGGQRV